MDAARAVLNQMLGRLHQTHFAIVPGELYSNVDSLRGDTPTGIDVRVTGRTGAGDFRGPGFVGLRAGRAARLGDIEDRSRRTWSSGRETE